MQCLARWLLLLKTLLLPTPTVAQRAAPAFQNFQKWPDTKVFQMTRLQAYRGTLQHTWTSAYGSCSSSAGTTTQKRWSTHTSTGARFPTNYGRPSRSNTTSTHICSHGRLQCVTLRTQFGFLKSRTGCKQTHTGMTFDGYFQRGTNLLPPEAISFNVCVGTPTNCSWQERAPSLTTALPLCKGGTRTTASISVYFAEPRYPTHQKTTTAAAGSSTPTPAVGEDFPRTLGRGRNHRRWRFRHPPRKRSKKSSRRNSRSGAGRKPRGRYTPTSTAPMSTELITSHD